LTDIVFRAPTDGDRDLLLRLIAAFHDEHGDPIDRQTLVRAVGDIVSGHPLVAVALICADRRPIGYLALGLGYSIEVGGGDFYIDEIYVEPRWRGRGIGRAAMAHAMVEAQRRGARRVCLEVVSGNDRAKQLYQRLGFRGGERALMFRSVVGPELACGPASPARSGE